MEDLLKVDFDNFYDPVVETNLRQIIHDLLYNHPI